MSVSEKLATISDLVERKGMKMTMRRKAIIRVMLEHREQHFSAEEIYAKVRAVHPNLGIATVYRNMDLFFALRIIEKLTYDPDVTRFNLLEKEQEHTSHSLRCKQCRKMTLIKEDWLADLEERLQREFGFKVLDHQFILSGIYQHCSEQSCRRKASNP